MKFIFQILFAGIIISPHNSSSKPVPPKELRNISYSFNGNLDQGVFDSVSYQNNYFGFSIANPGNGWTVLNQEKYHTRDSVVNTRENYIDLFTATKTKANDIITNYKT